MYTIYMYSIYQAKENTRIHMTAKVTRIDDCLNTGPCEPGLATGAHVSATIRSGLAPHPATVADTANTATDATRGPTPLLRLPLLSPGVLLDRSTTRIVGGCCGGRAKCKNA